MTTPPNATPREGWRDSPEPSRALVVRNRADAQYLAIEQQSERIGAFCRRVHQAGGLLRVSRAELGRGTADLDFFLLCLRRLLHAGQLVHGSGLPTTNALRAAIRSYESAVQNVARVRDVLEHLDETAIEGRGGVGYGVGADSLTVAYGGVTLRTEALTTAAATFHRAVRQAVDPIAARGVDSQPPIVDLSA